MNIRQSNEIEVVLREMTVHRVSSGGSFINERAWDESMRAPLTKIRQRLVVINALRRHGRGIAAAGRLDKI
jgi:hypothetical protein